MDWDWIELLRALGAGGWFLVWLVIAMFWSVARIGWDFFRAIFFFD